MTAGGAEEPSAAALGALAEWARRRWDAEMAAAEADQAEDEALRGPHEPGPEFTRSLDAGKRAARARLAQERAWAAVLALSDSEQGMPAPAREYAAARARAEDLWVRAASALDAMQAAAAPRPSAVLREGGAPEQVRGPWFRLARAARAALVPACVPLRDAGEGEYARLASELGDAREELAEACDALPGRAPKGAGRHSAWDLKEWRRLAAEATKREAELAAELAAWVGELLGPPPGKLN